MTMKQCFLLLALFVCMFPAWAFKVYISADMEGATGITCRTQILNGEGAERMTEDINVCIAACFEAWATEVVVRDGHSRGTNVDPTKIDPRARLIQGKTPRQRFKDIDGSQAMILLGYHAMSLTPNAILAHSYSSLNIQARYINGREVGEIGLDALSAEKSHKLLARKTKEALAKRTRLHCGAQNIRQFYVRKKWLNVPYVLLILHMFAIRILR